MKTGFVSIVASQKNGTDQGMETGLENQVDRGNEL